MLDFAAAFIKMWIFFVRVYFEKLLELAKLLFRSDVCVSRTHVRRT